MTFSTLSKFLLAAAIATVASHASARPKASRRPGTECGSARIKSIAFGKSTTTQERICTNTRRDELKSFSCRTGKCGALTFNAAVEAPPTSEAGKPGFQLCSALGGVPEMISVQFKTEWFKLDRCVFPLDGSFIDTGSLMKRYREGRSRVSNL